MERERFLSQVDLETPFQADLELEADEFESNNNVQNEPNENDSEPEKVQYCFEALWGLRMTKVACVFNLITCYTWTLGLFGQPDSVHY